MPDDQFYCITASCLITCRVLLVQCNISIAFVDQQQQQSVRYPSAVITETELRSDMTNIASQHCVLTVTAEFAIWMLPEQIA